MAQHVRFVAANVSIFNKRVTATGIIIVLNTGIRLVLLHIVSLWTCQTGVTTGHYTIFDILYNDVHNKLVSTTIYM